VFTFAPQARKAGCRLWSSAGILRWSMQVFIVFFLFSTGLRQAAR